MAQILADAEGWAREISQLESKPRSGRQMHVFFSDVEAALGAKLIEVSPKRSQIDTFIGSWDKSGDGSLSKGEFRMQIKSIGVHGAYADVDALFDHYDDDNSGKFDMFELRQVMGTLHRRLMENRSLAAEMASTDFVHPDQQRIDALRAKIRAAKAASHALRQIEKLELEIEELKRLIDGTLHVQLGALLVKRGINVAEVVGSWIGPRGKEGHGRELKKSEFIDQMQRLGLTLNKEPVTSSQFSKLFDEVDDDLSGYLDLKEAKMALKKWQMWSKEAYDELRDKEAQLSRLRRLVTSKMQDAMRPINVPLVPKEVAEGDEGDSSPEVGDPSEDQAPTFVSVQQAHAAHAALAAARRARHAKRYIQSEQERIDAALELNVDTLAHSSYLWERCSLTSTRSTSAFVSVAGTPAESGTDRTSYSSRSIASSSRRDQHSPEPPTRGPAMALALPESIEERIEDTADVVDAELW